MKKGNVVFVSFICVVALAGNAFCAKTQNNTKELKTNIAAYVQEGSKALNSILSQEQEQAEVLAQVEAKLAKVEKQYPESAKTIDAVFSAIKELIGRGGTTPEFLAQNYITPLEADLSPALVSLQKQNTGAFYATMSIIDVVYPTQRGNASLSDIIDFVDGYIPFEGSRVRDTDYLIYSLTADPYKDALWLFDYLEKKEPEVKNTTEYVRQKFNCVINNYNGEYFGSKVWAQKTEGCLEDFESDLATVKVLNPRLYGKLVGIVNRKYNTKNRVSSIALMVKTVDETLKNYIVADTGLVQDPRGILESLNAYAD